MAEYLGKAVGCSRLHLGTSPAGVVGPRKVFEGTQRDRRPHRKNRLCGFLIQLLHAKYYGWAVKKELTTTTQEKVLPGLRRLFRLHSLIHSCSEMQNFTDTEAVKL